MLFVDGLYWGKVIDADTGKPIAGASVAKYMEAETWCVTFHCESYADVRETVTDKNGFFFLPVNRRILLWPLFRARASVGHSL
jgi:hypothetical protein